MRPWSYPVLLGLIVLLFFLCTAGSAWIVGCLAGRIGVLLFLLIPALAMLARAVRCREPRAGLWFVFGAAWAPFVWLALPVALAMSLRPAKYGGS